MVVGLPHTLCSRSVQTTDGCCSQKLRCRAQQERGIKFIEGRVKELNESEPLKTCRKGIIVLPSTVSARRDSALNVEAFFSHTENQISCFLFS